MTPDWCWTVTPSPRRKGVPRRAWEWDGPPVTWESGQVLDWREAVQADLLGADDKRTPTT